MQPPIPTRWRNGGRFGRLGNDRLWSLAGVRVREDDPRFDLLRDALMQGDPLADASAEWMANAPRGEGRAALERALALAAEAVPTSPTAPPPNTPPAIAELVASALRVPPWLDRRQLRLATETILRCGKSNLHALGGLSLMSGYLSGATIKVLVRTGALTSMARRRLAETSRFVFDVARSGDVNPASEGFRATVRVRVMHALVRRATLQSPDWRTQDWGIPINQSDMLGTALEFSTIYVIGIMSLGFWISRAEREAIMHLWRYVGWVMGVSEELLPATFVESLELLRVLTLTTQGPDDDSRALAAALLAARREAARDWRARAEACFLEGFSRLTLGRDAADALGLPDNVWKFAPLVVAPPRLAREALVRFLPGAREAAVERGRAAIHAGIEADLEGRTPDYQPYAPPRSIAGHSR